MAKYNVGDKVRIVSKRGAMWNRDGKMDKYCGTVMTILRNDKWGCDGLYAMEEDKHENHGCGWCWSDDDIVGLVKDETPKYKVGDRVIIDESNIEGIVNFKGKDLEGTIMRIDSNPHCKHPYWVSTELNPYGIYCSVKCLAPEKKEAEEKIVITHDGKTTTATLYRADGSKETATARCAPEDTFNFAIGAKIAMDRLEEKVNPVNIDGFKVGDRVNFNGVNGTVICLAASGFNRIGVELDEETDIAHDCEVIPLIAGTRGTKGTSRWVTADEIEHGEAPEQPKYPTFKVVCVDNGIIPDDFTVGKVYTFVDGNCENDLGGKAVGDLVKNCDELNSRFKTVKFIPFVEDTEDVEDDTKPLTTEELKKMDGKEVYVSSLDDDLKESFDDRWGNFEFSGWHKVNVKESKLVGKTGYYYLSENGIPNGYRAYRKKPTEAAK